MKHFIAPLVTTFLLLFVSPDSNAQSEKPKRFSASGYVKHLQTSFFTDNADDISTLGLLHHRLNLKYAAGKKFNLRLEARNRLFYGEQVRSTPSFSRLVTPGEEFIDMSKTWIEKKSLVLVSNIDRASISYSATRLIVTAGRQRINWGINNIWNPNDLFNAFNVLDFDYEERPGSDAVRIQYYGRAFNAIEFAMAPSDKKDESVTAALLKMNKYKYDFQFLAGVCKGDYAAGTGFAGNIKDAGFKGEITLFKNKTSEKLITDIVASIMSDYSFKNNWYSSVAALYIRNPPPVLQGVTTPFPFELTAKSLMPYRYSFYGSVMKSFSPVISATLSVIYSNTDNNTVIFPSVVYNIAEDFDIDLTIQSFFTDNNGSFHTTASTVFLRLRWSY